MNLLHDSYVLVAGAGIEPARGRKVLRVNFIDIVLRLKRKKGV